MPHGGTGAVDRVYRRDRRRCQGPRRWQAPPGGQRRARADVEPAADRAGRLRHASGDSHLPGGDQSARHPRRRAQEARAIRPHRQRGGTGQAGGVT
eukprot:1195910-Prorocentrum_minimum.AAC.1